MNQSAETVIIDALTIAPRITTAMQLLLLKLTMSKREEGGWKTI
jgi:hypothetical protein